MFGCFGVFALWVDTRSFELVIFVWILLWFYIFYILERVCVCVFGFGGLL